jgi:hypothetical protein
MKNNYLLSILSICLLISLTISGGVTVNKLDGISSNNLVYSGYLPVSDTSSDQLFFTFYSAKDAKQ